VIFETPALNFSKNCADGDDILGDAYEYLLPNFAPQSGKSKGQFYTPAAGKLFQSYWLNQDAFVIRKFATLSKQCDKKLV